MGVYIIDMREICKPVLKLDFTAHCIVESLSEFVPSYAHGTQVNFEI
jgi:hypothetical protein